MLPLGLDTLGVSISLGMKSHSQQITVEKDTGVVDSQHAKRLHAAIQIPQWLRSALLFSLAEMLMPLVGLAIGYAASLFVSNIMHYVGALLLIGVGVWELREEGREFLSKRKKSTNTLSQKTIDTPVSSGKAYWSRQFLLAFSISLDELVIGFSLGTLTVLPAGGTIIHPITLCILIGLQGFLMALLGLMLGRTLRTRLKPVREWSELLSAFLLIGLGIWLFVT